MKVGDKIRIFDNRNRSSIPNIEGKVVTERDELFCNKVYILDTGFEIRVEK